MQNTALIVHDIMESPSRWWIRGQEITNGYYRISLNVSKYGAGEAQYFPTPSESESLKSAIDFWKRKTGYEEEGIEREGELPPVVTQLNPVIDDVTARLLALNDFFDSIKKAHAAYLVHMDPAVLSNGVGKSIFDYEGKFAQAHEQGNDKNSQKAGV